MNQHLQHIRNIIQQDNSLSEDQKNDLLNTLKKIDKEMEILSFKLDRTEKVKRTTAILLEETIEELEQKRKAVEETNAALHRSMDELKAAQAQLIHAEKMASLGELTAGIAHEIQNPLNFVNNFSEVSIELIEELAQESAVGSQQLSETKSAYGGPAAEIINDIVQNLQKISLHGRRASDIVKSMLEHSRAAKGEKQPTDLNALADEYLRLAYHGLRAKDKSFTADFRLEADKDLPKVNVVPQDIGRVLLNLINNAFYAVSAKASTTADKDYKPTVIVATRHNPPLRGDMGGTWSGDMGGLISVTDNGNGIPDGIKDKIFQPFFTTKPTGEGTGLGLSLSYDIITKGHGGELKVVATEDGGSCFIIFIPINDL